MNGRLLYLFHLPTLQIPNGTPPCRKQRKLQNPGITRTLAIFYRPCRFFLDLSWPLHKSKNIRSLTAGQRRVFYPFLSILSQRLHQRCWRAQPRAAAGTFGSQPERALSDTGAALPYPESSLPCSTRVSPAPSPLPKPRHVNPTQWLLKERRFIPSWCALLCLPGSWASHACQLLAYSQGQYGSRGDLPRLTERRE